MKTTYIVSLLCCVAFMSAIHAQMTLGIDWTRARIMNGWIGADGPTPVNITINNDKSASIFNEEINSGASSRWMYLASSASYTFESSAGYALNYVATDARVATYVLYGPTNSDPMVGVWTDSTEPPPRGQARIRFSSTVEEDLAVKIGQETKQLSASSDIKSYVEFDVAPGSVQITTEDNRFSISFTVVPDVTYRAIHVLQDSTHVVLMDVTCDYSVTGRWNTINLVDSAANIVRGGVGQSTQTLVMANSATQYDEYVPGNGQLQIMLSSQAINYNYQVNLFMAGFEEITMVIGKGISMNIDYIPETTGQSKVVFKNDWATTSIAVQGAGTLFANQFVGWSPYASLAPGSTTFTFTDITFAVTMTLEADNVYIVAFDNDGAVTMVQAESGAASSVRYIHAMTACGSALSLHLSSDTTSPIAAAVEYGTDSGYVLMSQWAGYYKYVALDETGTNIAAVAFRSQPKFSYSLISIGTCDGAELRQLFYWQDDNTLPAAGKARVKTVHGAYDTSPANPILQLDGEISLEQMTFGYHSELYKQISGGVDHVLNVAFDSKRAFNKTVFFADRSVSTVVTAGSWAGDTFDIFVFTDAVADSGPLSQQPQTGPTAAPSASPANSPSESAASSSVASISALGVILIALTLVH